MSATFLSADSFSNCFEIEFTDSSNIPDTQSSVLSAIRDAMPNSNFGSFLKSDTVTLRFSTVEESLECSKIISALPGVVGKILKISSHVALRCSWKGPSSLMATIKRLKSSAQSITNLTQSCTRGRRTSRHRQHSCFNQAHLGIDVDTALTSLTKLLFLAHETDTANRPTAQQLYDLNDKNFKIISYLKKSGADLAMRNEVDVLSRRCKNVPSPLKPCVCVITGDRDFSPTLANLRLEGFNDVI
ncbi:unnamed protein product [Sphagnum compactum]